MPEFWYTMADCVAHLITANSKARGVVVPVTDDMDRGVECDADFSTEYFNFVSVNHNDVVLTKSFLGSLKALFLP